LARVMLLAFALVSCGRQGGDDADETRHAYVKLYTKDPYCLMLSLDRTSALAAENINLTLKVRLPESAEVEFPTFDQKLGEFRVSGRKLDAPGLVGPDQIERTAHYVLEPNLPGEYELPAITVKFSGKSPGEATGLVTDPVKIEIKSVLPDSVSEPEIKDVLSVVGSRSRIIYLMAAALLAVAAALFAFAIRRRRKAKDEISLVPAHELAMRRIDAVIALRLMERGMTKNFYTCLSYVLRHYIEAGFGLRAPEKTTDEFLADVRDSRSFPQERGESLKAFLELCDLVKFAGHRPAPSEAQDAVSLCKDFVSATADDARLVIRPAQLLPGVEMEREGVAD